nr:insulinase family protein [bacterium]
GVSRGDPDYYSLSVMNYILGGGGFASRLMDNIRDNKGLVYDIHSYFAADRLGGTFQIGLQTKSESANLAISETIKEINRIRTELVTDEELSDAKAFLTGSFPMRIETGERIANFLVAVELYGLGSDYVDEYAGFINAVTSENILLIAKKYLHPEKLVIVVVGDQEKIALQEDFR